MFGRPTKQALVIDYKQQHPEKSNRQIAEDLGINRNTVNKWVKVLKEDKHITKSIMIQKLLNIVLSKLFKISTEVLKKQS